MSLFSKSISGWLGYSRRERRASFILVIIIFVIAAARFFVRPREVHIGVIQPAEIISETPLKRTFDNYPAGVKLYRFDPNKADYNALRRLGLSNRQARTLINYRSKGGKFKTGTDLLKIYGLDSSLARRLMKFVITDSLPASHNYSFQREKTVTGDKSRRNLVLTDLNLCDSASLEQLPAIGPVFASRIIKYRKLLGGFYTVEQLKEVYGVTDSVYDMIVPLICTDKKDVIKISINSANYSEFARHPYFQRFVAASILKFRKLSGSIDSIGQLTRNRIVDTATAAKIKPYLDFSHSASGDRDAKF